RPQGSHREHVAAAGGDGSPDERRQEVRAGRHAVGRAEGGDRRSARVPSGDRRREQSRAPPIPDTALGESVEGCPARKDLHDPRGDRHIRGGDEGRGEKRSPGRHGRLTFEGALAYRRAEQMRRRTFLTTSGMAAIGFGVTACGPKTAPNVTPRRLMVDLAPVKASWDRVIRTTVGLRPHRDPGFMLKPDKLDDKLVVHNYGHGGAGMSLAWGTGLMAAEFATEHQSRQAAVIGCGSVGLTCARQLQRRGFDVTIYALAIPPNVT